MRHPRRYYLLTGRGVTWSRRLLLVDSISVGFLFSIGIFLYDAETTIDSQGLASILEGGHSLITFATSPLRIVLRKTHYRDNHVELGWPDVGRDDEGHTPFTICCSSWEFGNGVLL